jgi:flavin reductase (DIM6/NTAB) family NADH-FMN oxidoreductase RutF
MTTNMKTQTIDFPWGSEYHQKFITNVGLITSDGPHGENIMAAEWTYLTSYSPAIIAVSIGPRKATAENIEKTKMFGVSIASEGQNWVSSTAGGSTAREYDKVAALKEMGVKFTKGKALNLLLVEGSALQAECRVIDVIRRGDHHLFLGEVVSARVTDQKPLAYHQNKYWKMDTQIEKPGDKKRAEMRLILEKHAKE